MKVYENVIQHGQYNKNITIREYDTNTKKISWKKISNNDFIPEIYSEEPLEGFVKSDKVTFDTQKQLFVKYFSKSSDLQRLVNPNKMTDEEKELKSLLDDEEITPEQEKRLTFLNEFRRSQNKEVQKDYYGNTNRVQKIIRDLYPDALKNDHEFHTIFIDIETRSNVNFKGFPTAEKAPEEITVIQMYCNKRKEYFIFGTKEWTGSYKSDFGNVNYRYFKTEKELLENLISFIEDDYPTCLYGFNTRAFDFPYIVNRIDNMYPELKTERLSPVKEISRNVKMKTYDDREYLGVDIKGIFLLDQRDLVLKYGFLSIPNFSLETVSTEGYGIKGKSKQKSYTYQSFDGNYSGEGWIRVIKDELKVPKDELKVWKLQSLKLQYPEKWSERHQRILEQAVYDTFMDYSIRDVEIMLEIEEKAKLIGISKLISYITGVNLVEVERTLYQWNSYLYKLTYSDNKILPLTQKKIKDDDLIPYKAGFTYANPGVYRYVLSVDFASLYPNIFVSTNIGADTIIPEHELPEELKNIRDKYCDFYTNENFYDTAQGKRESDEHWIQRVKGKKDGILTKKYSGDTNNIPEEKQWIHKINKINDFSDTLKKYNVTMTPDGYFYHHGYQSVISKSMEENIVGRYKAKYKGIELEGEIEDLKKQSKNVPMELIDEMEYQNSLSHALKIHINAAYGSMPLGGNKFSNGKLTAANLTITGRLLIHSVTQAVNNKIREILKEDETWEFDNIAQMDTDSAYICLDKVIEEKLPEAWKNHDDEKIMEFIQKLFQKILKPTINNAIKDITTRFNFYKPEALKMDQEIVSNAFISLIKKRYFTRILYSDGNRLSKPKIKKVGISLVSKSTPRDIKKILEPTLEYFLNNDKQGLEKYLKEHYNGFSDISLDGVAIPKGVSSIDYTPYYDKRSIKDWKIANKFCKTVKDLKKSEELGYQVTKLLTAPENSVGSIVYNYLIDENNINIKYEYINNHDKINIIHLKTPNPVTNNFSIIGFKDPDALDDLGLRKYINWDKIWEKEIFDKVDIIAEKINWKIDITDRQEVDIW